MASTLLYFQYGNYRHDAGSVEVQVTERSKEYSELGFVIKRKISLTVKGFLQGEPDTLNAQIAALELAYSQDGRNAVLYKADGTPTHISLLSAGTLDGIKVVRQPVFPKGNDTELVNLRSFEVGLEATYLATDTAANVISFSESIDLFGGGPKIDCLLSIIGLPQFQTLNAYTPYEAVQSGNAVGLLDYPTPPDSLIGTLIELPKIKRGNPERSGPVGDPRFTHYPISWEYRTKSTGPINGIPGRANF